MSTIMKAEISEDDLLFLLFKNFTMSIYSFPEYQNKFRHVLILLKSYIFP
jgi:hypothetical protein